MKVACDVVIIFFFHVAGSWHPVALRDLHRRRGCFTFFRCLSALRDQIAANDVRCPVYKLGVSRLYAIRSPPMMCVARSINLVSFRIYATQIAADGVHGTVCKIGIIPALCD